MAKINKSAFVRELPASMSAEDVVKAASAKGIRLTDKFVHTIRYNAKVAAAKKAGTTTTASAPAAAPTKRGPGRPPKTTTATPIKRGPGRPPKRASTGAGVASNGLVAEVERIVEAKVNALLRERLGALLG
jgi:hypothetical protein